MSGEKQQKRSVSLFEIPSQVIRNHQAAFDRLHILAHTNPNEIKPREADFLKLLIECAAAKSKNSKEPGSTAIFSYHEFQTFVQRHNAKTNIEKEKVPAHRSSIQRRVKSLADIGFFTTTELETINGLIAPKRYTLKNIHDENLHTNEYHEFRESFKGRQVTERTNVRSLVKKLRSGENNLIQEISSVKPVTDTMFTGWFDRAMRFSTKEIVEGNEIMVTMNVMGAKLIIQARSAGQLAALTDQRTIRACVTHIAHIIDRKLEDARNKKAFGEQQGFFGNESMGVYDHETLLDVSEEAELNAIDPEEEVDIRDVIHNEFYLDVVDLAKLMNYQSPSSSSTRSIINESLQRLYDTNFRLVIADPNTPEAKALKERFGLDDYKLNFRFLTELRSQYDMSMPADARGANGGGDTRSKALDLTDEQQRARDQKEIDPYSQKELTRVRIWQVAIDSKMFNRLKQDDVRMLYLAHFEIMKESNGLAHTIYNLMCSIIGRTSPEASGKKERVYHKALSTLHNTLWPTRRYDRFVGQVIEVLKKHARQKETYWDKSLKRNKVAAFGFVFVLYENADDGNKLWLKVRRDREDKVTGDRSYHNLKMLDKLPQTSNRSQAANSEAR